MNKIALATVAFSAVATQVSASSKYHEESKEYGSEKITDLDNVLEETIAQTFNIGTEVEATKEMGTSTDKYFDKKAYNDNDNNNKKYKEEHKDKDFDNGFNDKETVTVVDEEEVEDLMEKLQVRVPYDFEKIQSEYLKPLESKFGKKGYLNMREFQSLTGEEDEERAKHLFMREDKDHDEKMVPLEYLSYVFKQNKAPGWGRNRDEPIERKDQFWPSYMGLADRAKWLIDNNAPHDSPEVSIKQIRLAFRWLYGHDAKTVNDEHMNGSKKAGHEGDIVNGHKLTNDKTIDRRDLFKLFDTDAEILPL